VPAPDALSRAAAAVVDLYRAGAEDFIARRSLSLFERPWLDRMLALAPPGRIVDLGCGAGRPIAAYVAGQGRAVEGVDGSEGLLAAAARDLPDQTWRRADMRTWNPDTPAAGVIAWHSLFHLRPAEQAALLARIGGWLVPGGVLMFTSGGAAGETLGDWNGAPLYHASLDPDGYRAALAAAGLAVAAHVRDDPSTGDATIWLARKAG
jgi:SAM-dependent methyltransferase